MSPSAREWGELYKASKKQSLVGVCFAGLQRLGADADEGFARTGISEMLYLIWMGMTAQIQKKDETVKVVTLHQRKSEVLVSAEIGNLDLRESLRRVAESLGK